MKKIPHKYKKEKKHVYIGYTLIVSGIFGLLLVTVQIVNIASLSTKSAIPPMTLGTQDEKLPQSDASKAEQEVNPRYYYGKNSSPTLYPTPTLLPPDSPTTQQIIYTIFQQFNNTTITPTQEQPNNLNNTQQNNSTQQENTATQKNMQTNTNNNNTTTAPTPTNSQPSNAPEQILLPSDSLQTTQETLNTVLKDQGIHVTIKNVDNETVITAVNNQGKIVHLSSDLVNQLSDVLLQDLYPKIIKVSDNDYLIKKGHAVAETHFPVTFDATNTPVISYGTDNKQITFLPDQAASHIVLTGLMDTIGNTSLFTYIIPHYTPPPTQVTMKLVTVDDQPAYAISGSVKKKILNFIPIPIQRTVYLSAANSAVMQMDENWFYSLLDKISQ